MEVARLMTFYFCCGRLLPQALPSSWLKRAASGSGPVIEGSRRCRDLPKRCCLAWSTVRVGTPSHFSPPRFENYADCGFQLAVGGVRFRGQFCRRWRWSCTCPSTTIRRSPRFWGWSMTAMIIDASGVRSASDALAVGKQVAVGQFFWLDISGGDSSARHAFLTAAGLNAADAEWALRFGQAGMPMRSCRLCGRFL